MATPILLAQLNGDLSYENAGAGGTATGSGALRWFPGHTAGVQAAFVEEFGVNTATNPSAAYEYFWEWGWTHGPDTTRTTSLPSSPYPDVTTGAYVNDTTANAYTHAMSGLLSGATNGRTFTGSVSIYWPIAMVGKNLIVQMRGYTGGTQTEVTAQTFTPVEGWNRFAVTRTLAASNLTGLRLAVLGENRMVGDKYYITAVNIEEKTYDTTYISGDRGVGYSWVGTAYDSFSTRAETTITIPTALPTSVAVRYSEDGQTWNFGYLESLGALGSYGSITHNGTGLVISSNRKLWVGPVFAFADTLTGGEQAALQAAGTWTLNMLNAGRTFWSRSQIIE